MRVFLETDEVSPLRDWHVDLPALWLAPETGRACAADVALLRRIFPGHECCVWSVSDGGAASPAVKKVRRAFGEWPGLRSSVVVKEEMTVAGEHFYCDIALVESKDDACIAELAGRTLWGKNSGLFMARRRAARFPEDLLSLCRAALPSYDEDRRCEREQLLGRYLASAKLSEDIPLLVVQDSNVRQFFVAPGHDRLPADAVIRIVGQREFEEWLSPGVDLRILT